MKKTAIITGGTGSIGSALVREFSRDHAVVFTYVKSADEARRLVDECGAVAVCCDGADSRQVEELAERYPHCDLLINNAGISAFSLLQDVSDEDWHRMLDVNLSSAFYFARAFLPGMIREKQGAILNISSVWGVHGASCEVAYSAAKAGLIGFTKALAKEAAPSGITVNCIAPGVIEGRMNAHFTEEERNALVEATPLGRLGRPEDVAIAARYLAEAGFVTGQVLGVDGGFY